MSEEEELRKLQATYDSMERSVHAPEPPDLVRALIQDQNGQNRHCTLEISVNVANYPESKIVLKDFDVTENKFEDRDTFDALVKLRNWLAERGCIILCQGARENVWPSGMGRCMGGGRKAYIMEIGKPATELVNIFDEAQPEQIVDTKTQRIFFERWKNSILKL